MSDLQETTLEAVCQSIDYGLTASAQDKPSDYKFLRITDIVSNQINWSSVPYVSVDPGEAEKYLLNDDDIVIARTGATTGYSAYIQNSPKTVFASYLVRYKVKPEYNARYISYCLKSTQWWSYIRGVLGDKSAQPNASASTMAKFRFKELPRKDQDAIAQILGDIDDKIILNQRMNETLEAMARALFKSWFVDFDPVRAKAEGRKPEGMDVATAALFPAAFNDDGLPEGWDKVPFSGLIEIIGGGTPKTSISEYWNGTIPWFSVVDAPADTDIYVTDTEKKITQAGVDNSSTKVLPFGTTIISARGTVGRVALVGVPMAMNQSCYAIRGDGLPDYFTYFAVRQLVTELKARTHGSVFDTITRDTFDTVSFVKTDKGITEAFDKRISPIMQKVLNNLHESKTLSDLRDALLPKLISGELRIDAVDQEATEVVAVGEVVEFPKKAKKASGKANEQFREAILVAGIVRGWGSQQYPLGNFRLQKAAYLVHRKAEHDTNTRRHAAGPYNPDMKYRGGIGIAKKNGYVQDHKSGKFTGLIAASGIDDINSYLPRYDFGSALGWVLREFRGKTNDQLELLTTIDDAAQGLRAEGKAVDADAIIDVIKNEPNWMKKLEKPIFSKANIQKSLTELARLFPEQVEG